MTIQEFSDQFDTLLNSYNIAAGFGEGANKQGGIALNEYEKSVMLTQAQDNIVKTYFDASLNSQRQGFDDSSRRQIDFSSLIKVKTLNLTKEGTISADGEVFDERGWTVELKDLGTEKVKDATDENSEDWTYKPLFILNERLKVGNKTYVIVPINYREYDREMSKAYAQPLKKQAWRVFHNIGTGYDVTSEIIPIYGTVQTTDTPLYVMRYVMRPSPIVLTDLPDGLTVDGMSKAHECSLNPILHMDILTRAYELALTTRGGGTAVRQQQQQGQQQ